MSRISAYKALAEEFEINPDDANSSAEDMAEVLEKPEQLSEWCAITRSPMTKITYLYPRFDDLAEAQKKADENIGEPMFEELPVAVVNLDTGQRLEAHLSTSWRDATND